MAEDPNERFMREHHPDKWAALQQPHRFVPPEITSAEKPGHVCNGGCFCDACWAPKSDKRAHPRALQR